MGFLVTLLPRPSEAQGRSPIRITQVVVSQGQLLALGKMGGTGQNAVAFVLPLRLTPRPGGNTACPILDLQLGPIDLTLLGLHVETSEICLAINAQPGPGNLLGNLLCRVANLLNQGVSLDRILASLGPQNTRMLLAGLASLIQGALDQIFTSASTNVTNLAPVLECPILHLELGPIFLNLLGLVVELDDCHNGPVTVDITAIPGGGLLGDLLCGLANVLNPRSILEQIIAAILGLP